ncbi:MAG: exodeoxyribonuclease VII small subunit [Candidatus Moranbacteria bacterium]|nr:exodeoxyribonuclease VII small subunit [Candidatus Moranbacteria bacterium]
MKPEKNNLSQDLQSLEKIVGWFESQEDIDIEEGLQKIRQGAELIQSSKKRLKEVENEFEEIRKTLDQEV